MSDFEVRKVNGGVSITKYCGTSTSVVIPDTIDGEDVVELDSKCFAGQKKIKEIIISNNVQEIGNKAFSECSSLKKVIFPKDICQLGCELFEGCKKMQEIYFDTNPLPVGEAFLSDDVSFFIKMPKRYTVDDDWAYSMFDGFYMFVDPRDNIVSGYDLNYDSSDKKISKTKDGIYYFENKKGIVITHGPKPYDFIEKELIIPSQINGKPVVAIGTEAFLDAKFIHLELPDSIKVISALAFTRAKFDFLKMPSKLDYLNNYWCGDKNLFSNIIEESLQLQYDGKINFSNVILMPEQIDSLENDSLCGNDCCLIFPNNTSYNLEDSSITIPNVFYDDEKNIIYKKEKDFVTVLFASKATKVEDIPTSIDGLRVEGWDVNIIKQLTKEVSTVKESYLDKQSEDSDDKVKEAKDDGVEIGYSLDFKLLNEKLFIPENVKHIFSYFDYIIKYNDKPEIVFPKNLISIEGIDAMDEPFFVPQTVETINKAQGLIIALKGSNLKPQKTDDLNIVTGIEEIRSYEDYKYIVLDDGVCLIKYLGKEEKATFPSDIDGMPVKSAYLKYGENVKHFILDNKYWAVEKYTNDSQFDFNLTFESSLDTFEIGGCFKKIKLLKDLIGDCCPKKIILQEGVLDIEGNDEYELNTFGDSEPEEEKKVTAILPKSLKHVGSEGLKGLNICYVSAYDNTIFDDEAVESYCEITFLDGGNNSVPQKSNSLNDNFLDDDSSFDFYVSNSSDGGLLDDFVFEEEEVVDEEIQFNCILNKIIEYDLSNISDTTMREGYEVLNSNNFYNFNFDIEHASIEYKSTSTSPYFIRAHIENNTGKVSFSCTCTSSIGHQRVLCKHVVGFILFVKQNFKSHCSTTSKKTAKSIKNESTGYQSNKVQSCGSTSSYISINRTSSASTYNRSGISTYQSSKESAPNNINEKPQNNNALYNQYTKKIDDLKKKRSHGYAMLKNMKPRIIGVVLLGILTMTLIYTSFFIRLFLGMNTIVIVLLILGFISILIFLFMLFLMNSAIKNNRIANGIISSANSEIKKLEEEQASMNNKQPN